MGTSAPAAASPRGGTRVETHGKSFLLDGSPFLFRGLGYRSSPETLGLHLAGIPAAGYTVVSTRQLPSSGIEQAVRSGLHFLLEFDDASLGGLATASRRERKRLVRDAAARIRREVRAWDGSEALLGVVFGKASRLGRPGIAAPVEDELAIALHNEDAGLLAAWRGLWPLDARCPAEFDFLVVDFELSRRDDMAPTLMACHSHVGDRPLVVGDVLLADPEQGGRVDMAWLVDTALRCGAGGTIAPEWSAPETNGPDSKAARINRRTVRDLDVDWPSISVVVCVYNAEATLDECLSHCERLEYPKLELIVVDDESTDASREIAAAHPRARLIAIHHGGLTVARNTGYRSARLDLVVYLDQDAYPSPEWPWYVALAALEERAGGAGGPNVPPPDEPVSARAVAMIPGGPVPQLLDPQRAEHLPGCNMAFWRDVLEQLDGFDPVLEAGDDVEFEWRVVQSGHEMAYHPAALVWHHRRPGVGPFLRQQRNYGRSRAVFERRYPERYPPGFRIRKAAARLCSRAGSGGSAGSCDVKYLTLPRNEGTLLELAHQWGMPLAVALGLTAPLGLVHRKLAAPALGAAAFVGTLFATDVALAGQGRRRSERRLVFRARVSAFRLLRPLAFRWGHLRGWWELRLDTPNWPPAPAEASAKLEAEQGQP